MNKLLKKLFPICRSITGAGLKKSIDLILSSYPKNIIKNSKIIKLKTGLKAYGWTIPKEWVIKDAYLKKKNKYVIDFKKNNLHVINYSYPIKLINCDFDIIKKYLFYELKKKNSIPYITSYYKKKIGLCLSYNNFKKLKKGKYDLVINTHFKKGFSYLMETIVKGKKKEEVFFTTYLCHPSMANNELSGPIIMSEVCKWLQSKKKNRYTYRFVVGPETIGAIFYIKRNLNILRKRVNYAFNLTCQGGGKEFSFLPSKNKNTQTDKICLNILKFHYGAFKKYSFQDRGSDERQYCGPHINLPMVSVMKKKYHEYKEYHTSEDNLKFLKISDLKHTLGFYKKAIFIIENNYKCSSRYPCEPFLESHFKFNKQGGFKFSGKMKLYLDILIYCDGKNTILDICEILNISFLKNLKYFKNLRKKNLIKFI